MIVLRRLPPCELFRSDSMRDGGLVARTSIPPSHSITEISGALWSERALALGLAIVERSCVVPKSYLVLSESCGAPRSSRPACECCRCARVGGVRWARCAGLSAARGCARSGSEGVLAHELASLHMPGFPVDFSVALGRARSRGSPWQVVCFDSRAVACEFRDLGVWRCVASAPAAILAGWRRRVPLVGARAMDAGFLLP